MTLRNDMAKYVRKVYDELAAATDEYHSARIVRSETQAALEGFLADGLFDGSIKGKNEQEREGCARSLNPVLYEDLAWAKKEEALAYRRLALANVQERSLQAELRVLELTVEEKEIPAEFDYSDHPDAEEN